MRVKLVMGTVLFLGLAVLVQHVAVAQKAPPSANSPAANSATARMDAKAKALLDQTIQALGGSAFLNMKSRTSQGRVFAISDGATAGFAPFESAVVFPYQRRLSYGKGKPVILLNDGDRGWEYDRYGLIRQSPEQVKHWKLAQRYGMENLLRLVVHEPDTLVLDGGVDFVDLLPVRVLEITDSDRVQSKVYIHRTSMLPLRVTYRIQNPKYGEWDVMAEAYGDYREIEGIQTPMHVTRYQNDERVNEYFLKSAEYNKEYPPEFFRPTR